MSPASGDQRKKQMDFLMVDGFHSIDVPSEWGQQEKAQA